MATERPDRDFTVLPRHQQNIHGITATNGSYLFAGDVRNISFSQPRQTAPSLEDIIKRCRDALFISHPDADRASIADTKGQRAPGTCEWILENSHCQAWLDKKSPLFWISGGPGTGKTVMSLFLSEQVDKMCRGTNDHLLVYFCRFQYECYNNPVNLLRSLAYQLLDFSTDLSKVKEVSTYLDTPEKAKNALCSLECLWKILVILLSQSDLSTVYCIVDGIDECQSSEMLASKFRDYCRDVDILSVPLHSQNLKCPLDATFIDTDAMDIWNGIKIDRDYEGHVNDDITTFIKWSLEPLQMIHDFDAIRPQIEKTLLIRSEGTFLWVSFATHELLKKKTRLQILETLQDIPAGLYPIYGRMLHQIDSTYHYTTACILKWIAITMRPLTLDELAYATGKDVEEMADMIAICQPLLKITDDRVLFIHQSAKGYLLRDEPDDDPIAETFRIEASKCHGEIAHKCLQVLEQSCLQREGLSRMSFDHDTMAAELQLECDLFKYANLHWTIHARLSPKGAKHLFNFDRPFFKKSSGIRKTWATFNGVLSQRIHMASFLGNVPWLQALREEAGPMSFFGAKRWKRWVNAEVNIATPLEYAVKGGFEDAVRFLLDHGANREINSATMSIMSAFRRGNISELLIKNGVMLGRSKGPRTPLMDAASAGFTSVAQELLNLGADINARNNDDETALVLAAVSGHKEVFHFLLQHGAQFDIVDFRTWLHQMSQTTRSGWSTEVVQTILQCLTDICWSGEDGSRLLILATKFADFEIVQLCLAKGVDVNWKHPNGTTALVQAILQHRNQGPAYIDLVEAMIECRLEDLTGLDTYSLPVVDFLEDQENPRRIAERLAVVAALLDHGADANLCADLEDGLCPPLVAAACLGNNWAVEELLEHGADCNARAKTIGKSEPRNSLFSSLLGRILPQPEVESGIEGGSALIHAAQFGHVSTLRVLLAYGSDTGLVNEHGKTALECAFEKGHQEIEQVLMEHDEALGWVSGQTH
ncbi:NACHT ankyrin domain-containing protein [Fusarium mexicanum]|uniref:NACHT ankyrin domain-containing protein n=1 Tax=Fusarium mexicanum TaxID=751941 RepID=A0A8H5IAQ7_9HYPO|nr:NACHT ankyrin domain-containing protein [Fusarium mexicanum]